MSITCGYEGTAIGEPFLSVHLYLCQFWGSDSGPRLEQQVPLTAGPSCKPLKVF